MDDAVMQSTGSVSPDQPGDAAAPDAAKFGALAGWWAVFVVFLLSVLSVLDRQIINLLVDPIRASLQISDFQMSLLQGFSFALFYALCGLPIGWLVDRGGKRMIIFAGVTLWAICASLCGLATRYAQLLLARIGVGVGEATLSPAAYALLGDLFPKERLALPLSVMGTGAQIGNALAFMGGGLLIAALPVAGVTLPVFGALQPWQLTLLLTGIPGLLLAPLIFTVREPLRRKAENGKAEAGNLRAALSLFWREKRFYLCHALGFGLAALCGYAMMAWAPTFLMRVHGWHVRDAALAIGGLGLFFSAPGAVILGFACDRWFSRGRTDAHLRLFAGALLIQAIAVVAAFSVSSVWITLALIAVQQALSAFAGVAAAALQIATPPETRGRISAIYLLIFNLVGMGLGPTSVAVFSDFLFRDGEKVGWSIALTFAIFAPLGAVLLTAAMKPMRTLTARA